MGQSLQPRPFVVFGALGGATALAFITRGEELTALVPPTLFMGVSVLAGLATLKAIRPLVTHQEIGRR